MPTLSTKPGQVLKLSPGANNPTQFKSLHLIHPDLMYCYGTGAVVTTWMDYEDTQMGGNLRLFPVGIAKASWLIPHASRYAVKAILDYANFVTLDTPVTIRTIKTSGGLVQFVDCNAIMSYLPDDKQSQNIFEVDGILLNFTEVAING